MAYFVHLSPILKEAKYSVHHKTHCFKEQGKRCLSQGNEVIHPFFPLTLILRS